MQHRLFLVDSLQIVALCFRAVVGGVRAAVLQSAEGQRANDEDQTDQQGRPRMMQRLRVASG